MIGEGNGIVADIGTDLKKLSVHAATQQSYAGTGELERGECFTDEVKARGFKLRLLVIAGNVVNVDIPSLEVWSWCIPIQGQPSKLKQKPCGRSKLAASAD